MANERIIPAQKITGGGIQLADLQNGEIGYDEAQGLMVRKSNDGASLSVYGKVGVVTATEVAVVHYTKTEVDGLIANAGGGDMLGTNNLSDVASAATARVNLDVRSTEQVSTEIGNAVSAVTLASLGGLDQAAVDARADARLAAQFDAAPTAYNNLQKIFAEMEEDDTDSAALLAAVGNKLDAGGTVGGRIIS